jgi:hypothetical protein
METKFSDREKRVIDYLHQVKVTTNLDIIQKLEVSKRTINRALSKYGYYSSYNYNASYYTLKDIPHFSDCGLWKYNDIGFSKYRSITETIVRLVNKSEAGYTNIEMSQLLGTETKNLLSRLCRQKRLHKFYAGHQAVYLSTDLGQQIIQKQSRTEQHVLRQQQQRQIHFIKAGILPQGIDVRTVILVLIHMIEKPSASVASISMSLQGKDVNVSAKQVRTIISFYGLEKKMVPSK